MYEAVIFDFFDVIRTDAYKAWLGMHGYKREGVFLDTVDRMDRGEIKLHEFLAKLSEVTGQPADEIFEEMETGAVLDHEVVALIEKLRTKYKLGLLSNAPSEFIRALINENDLEKHFHEIVISSEVGFIKPSSEIFNLMLEKLRIRPETAIFIDDNEINVRGSEKAGLKGILYTDLPSLKKDLEALGISY